MKIIPLPIKHSKNCPEQAERMRGNQISKAENLTEEANDKRLKAMIKGWRTKAKMQHGEKVVVKVQHKRKFMQRKRRRLNETIAKEVREIQEIARMNASSAMDRLVDIINREDSRDSDAISAIGELLNRAYGKSTQTNVNANINDNGKETEASSRELDSRINKALQRIETITGGAREAPKSVEGPPDVRLRNRNPRGPTLN